MPKIKCLDFRSVLVAGTNCGSPLRRGMVLGLTLVLHCGAYAQAPAPTLSGFVTRAISAEDFDVNGQRVLVTPKTEVWVGTPKAYNLSQTVNAPYIGMPMAIFGKANEKKHTIAAEKIYVSDPGPVRVKGFGVIDRVWTPVGAAPGSILVRADGYGVLIDKNTVTTFTPPLAAITDIGLNAWLEFSGMRRADGVIVSETVTITSNQVNRSETKLRSQSDYDPAAVDATSKQNLIHEAFIGFDPKKAAPYSNPGMQERVNRIADRLIPEYQRKLEDTDPTKVRFRFQLIDERRFHDALTLPSGVILIPYQVVERMENDAQLAAVLADNIATAIEKQSLRALPGDRAIRATELALYAAPFGFVGNLGVGAAEAARVRRQHAESGREAVALMWDAKYDVTQAPIAWWLLGAKKRKPISEIPLPDRALDLYQVLGTLWKPDSPLRNVN